MNWTAKRICAQNVGLLVAKPQFSGRPPVLHTENPSQEPPVKGDSKHLEKNSLPNPGELPLGIILSETNYWSLSIR